MNKAPALLRLAAYITSGDEEYEGCYLVVGDWKKQIPPVIKPVTKKRKSFINPENFFTEKIEKRIGFSYLANEGFLQVWLNSAYGDSSEDNETLSWLLPFQQWRFYEHRILNVDGSLWGSWANTTWGSFEEQQVEKSSAPTLVFELKDFDDTIILATCRIEEREWRLGEKPFEWLSLFTKPKIRKELSMEFSDEIGSGKWSWKGGTTACGIEFEQSETPEEAIKRFCLERRMTFVGKVQDEHQK